MHIDLILEKKLVPRNNLLNFMGNYDCKGLHFRWNLTLTTAYARTIVATQLLSYQLKQSAQTGLISAIKDMEANIVTNQRKINAQLKSLYENLYTSEANDQKTVGNFLEELEITSLNESHKSNLEWNITLDSPINYYHYCQRF